MMMVVMMVMTMMMHQSEHEVRLFDKLDLT